MLNSSDDLDSHQKLLPLKKKKKKKTTSLEYNCIVLFGIKSYLSSNSFDFCYIWVLHIDGYFFVRFKRTNIKLFDDLGFMDNNCALRFFFFRTTKVTGLSHHDL